MVQAQRVEQVRHGLLTLHKAIVDVQRLGHERVHGRVSAADFLQVLVNDPAHAWLRPLTAIIVQLDEVLEADPDDGEVEKVWLGQIRALLHPEGDGPFQSHYGRLLQDSPDVAFAHGSVLRALR